MLQFNPTVGLYSEGTDSIRVTVQTDWENVLGAITD